MKPLESSRQVLMWLYGIPPDKSVGRWQKIASIAVTLSFIIFLSLFLMCDIVFIHRNVSVNLSASLFALLQTAGATQLLYQSIATILLRFKLVAIFENLATIYDENRNGDLYHLLQRTNEKCEWMWEIFFKNVLGGFLISTLINVAVSLLYCYIIYGDIYVDQLYHPYKLVLPWNQSNRFGYLLELGLVIVIGEIYMISTGSILVLFISMCLHHQTFYKMFQNEAEKLNFRDEHRSDAEHLRKMITFHISVKDWFFDSAEAYSTFILIVLIMSQFALACCVFQLDLIMKHIDFALYMILVGIIAGISNLSAYCYFGKMATECYERMSECLYECSWHELKPRYQKYILIMMKNAQRPIYYHGFGIAVLNLQTFNKMIRTVLSYYMIFKTLTSN